MIEIDKKHDRNKEIFDLSRFMNCIVSVEPKKKSHHIPQCTKCQRYNHTKNYCKLSPRCLFCSLSHPSSECEKKKEDTVKVCANCGENHTANFKGYAYYSELKKKRFKKIPPTMSRDAPEAPPDAKRIRFLEKAEKMERYMTQILSALSRKPASVSTKQSEVTSEAGPSSLPTASCLLSPQTAPSQPAPAALSPPVRPNSCPPFPACSSSSLAPSIGGSYIWPGFCSLCWSLSAVGCRIPLHDPSSGPVGSFITHTLILDIMDSTMVDTRGTGAFPS
ncbi:hypothetical protein M8J75_002543 [Diaphorina citri]|nr:hypothetical protein M8J75_002543 [Diaphorina citri]